MNLAARLLLKAINEGVYRALADLDDEEDIVLTKSNIDLSRTDKTYDLLYKEDIIKLCKLNTPVFEYKDGFVLGNYSGLLLVGYCCATAKDTPDGLPRFCSANVLIDDMSGNMLEMSWSENGEYIEELGDLSFEEAEEDFDGYENTQILLKYKYCYAAKAIMQSELYGKNYYLPSVGELLAASNANLLYDLHYWSSNLVDKSYAYTYSAYEQDIWKTDKRAYDDNYIMPFIKITPENIYNTRGNKI